MPPDVLIRVRRGEINDSLRYALRSLANIEHGTVYIVGHRPRWLTNVEHIAGSTERSKWRIVLDHVAIACRELPGRELLLFDDDMYFTQRVERWPVYHLPGLLLDQAAVKAGSYGRSLRLTHGYLTSHGIRRPLSYELHVPLPILTDLAADVLTEAVATGLALQARSVYGNLANIGGTEMLDVKARPRHPDPQGIVVSTGPGVWRDWHTRLRRLFPDASTYERE